METKDIHTLHIMGEVQRGGSSSQRDLSRRLNLSLGLVNAFCKRLVSKGYFKVKTMPRNRVKYFLTPEGLARKSRLTVEYLRHSTSFYKEIKGLLLDKFRELEQKNIRTLLFFGCGEVAELAYLYLQLSEIRLAGIVDPEREGDAFFGYRIEGLRRLGLEGWDVLLLTRLNDPEQDMALLKRHGVCLNRVFML